MVERKVLTEIIELYRNLPCLWDLSNETYKDKNRKSVGWQTLATKWREIEPDTNAISVKKRIDNLKSSYKREAKKVKESKTRIGSTANEVYSPSLWYFNMMTFLDKKEEQLQTRVDTFSNIDELPQEDKARKKRGHSLTETNKRKLIETTQDILKQSSKKINTFGVYVGEQLESLSVQQRQIAEKLISDVIFLAKTENLNFDSRIETLIRQRSSFLSSPQIQSPYNSISSRHHSSSPKESSPIHQYNSPSPQFDVLSNYSSQVSLKTESSPQYNSSHSSSSFPPTPTAPHDSHSYSCKSPLATESHISAPLHITQVLHSSLPQIQTKLTIQPPLPQLQFSQVNSREFTNQNQEPQTKPTVTFPRFQVSTLSQTVQSTEEITENTTNCPAGSLLKELLILKKEET